VLREASARLQWGSEKNDSALPGVTLRVPLLVPCNETRKDFGLFGKGVLGRGCLRLPEIAVLSCALAQYIGTARRAQALSSTATWSPIPQLMKIGREEALFPKSRSSALREVGAKTIAGVGYVYGHDNHLSSTYFSHMG